MNAFLEYLSYRPGCTIAAVVMGVLTLADLVSRGIEVD